MKPCDLVGVRFVRLVVASRKGSNAAGQSLWLVRCDCGSEKVVLGHNLLRGFTKSCGCLRVETNTKHGQTVGARQQGVSPTYKSWYSMLQRCENPNHESYHNYGGRGITVCKRWHKFENFLADMGERQIGITLDRKDGSLGYRKNNCRWATPKEQANNPTNRSGGKFEKGHTRGGRPEKKEVTK